MKEVSIRNESLLKAIKKAQPKWFCAGNRRFFNDRSYYGVYGKKTGKAYLLRSTYAWTDMFGKPKTLHYRINDINQETHEINNLVDETFKTLDEAKQWLLNH